MTLRGVLAFTIVDLALVSSLVQASAANALPGIGTIAH